MQSELEDIAAQLMGPADIWPNHEKYTTSSQPTLMSTPTPQGGISSRQEHYSG